MPRHKEVGKAELLIQVEGAMESAIEWLASDEGCESLHWFCTRADAFWEVLRFLEAPGMPRRLKVEILKRAFREMHAGRQDYPVYASMRASEGDLDTLLGLLPSAGGDCGQATGDGLLEALNRLSASTDDSEGSEFQRRALRVYEDHERSSQSVAALIREHFAEEWNRNGESGRRALQERVRRAMKNFDKMDSRSG